MRKLSLKIFQKEHAVETNTVNKDIKTRKKSRRKLHMQLIYPAVGCVLFSFLIVTASVSVGLKSAYKANESAHLLETAKTVANEVTLYMNSDASEQEKMLFLRKLADSVSDEANNRYTFVLNMAGNVISFSQGAVMTNEFKAVADNALSGQSKAETITVNATEYLAAYAIADIISEGNTYIVFTVYAVDNATATINQVITNMGYVSMLFVIISAIVMTIISIKTTKPIKILTKVSKSIALGVDEEVPDAVYKNEFDDLMEAFRTMAASNRVMAEAAYRMAEGDFSGNVTPRSDEDVLGKAMKTLVENNNGVLKSVASAAFQINSGSEEIAKASLAIAKGASMQSSALEQVSVSMNGVKDKAKLNAENAGNAKDKVDAINKDVEKGQDILNNMANAMKEINEASSKIASIIKLIDDIAFQTNILSLNAAVEAASAGDYGRGFAVVADEVRNLAQRSAQAAADTAELIEDSIRKVAVGDKLTQSTLEAMNSIRTEIEDCTDLINTIAAASNDQSEMVIQISQAIEQVSDVVSSNSATSDECASASDELSGQAISLSNQLRKFKLK